MKKLIVVVSVLGAMIGAAGAGTPPALKTLVEHGQYYRFDETTKTWEFTQSEWPSNDDHGCVVMLEKAAKDGVPDTASVDVPYDTPLWKRGPHTVTELKAYCQRALASEHVSRAIASIEWGMKDGGSGDMAAKCIEMYEEEVKVFKVSGATKVPFEGMGTKFVDPATGDPWTGTLDEARKKFCDSKATEFLKEKADEEAPYRKVLKGAKLRAALEELMDSEVLGPGGKLLTIPQMAKANVWFKLKWYTDKHCNGDASKMVYAVERYAFTKKNDDYDATQKEYCGQPPKSAYK